MVISYAFFFFKNYFFNDTATTEIYTRQQSSAASDVYKRQEKIILRFIINIDYAVGCCHTSQKERVENHSTCKWSGG